MSSSGCSRATRRSSGRFSATCWRDQNDTPKWKSTFYTLQLLSVLGVPPKNEQGQRAMELLLDRGVQDDGRSRSGAEPGATPASRPCCFRWRSASSAVETGAWYFDVVRGLECFRLGNSPWDPRLEDALQLVLRRRTKDGRWKRQNRHCGQSWFELEVTGQPSRMNTLRASGYWAGLGRSALLLPEVATQRQVAHPNQGAEGHADAQRLQRRVANTL